MLAYDEMCAYVGFDEADQANLRALWPIVEPRAHEVIDHFYARIHVFESARAVFSGPEQVERLKRSLRTWLEEALTGPWDAAYVKRRLRIGHVHVKVGLESHYMYTAMSVILEDVHRIARDALSHEEVASSCDALQRCLMLDLALMTRTYVASREQRQMESVRKILIEHLRSWALLVDEAGTVVAGTESACSQHGELMEGRHWEETLPPELVDPVRQALLAGAEVLLPRIDAGSRSFLAHVVPLDGTVATHLIQVEELTAALRLEARLRRTETLAQLGTLSAAIAHELRNPLAGISGALQVIRAAQPKDTPHGPIMDKVVGEVRRLDSLVTDLLKYARPTAVQTQLVDLVEAVESTLGLVRGDAPHVQFDVQGHGTATADADKLIQILLNLTQNAIQAGATHVQVQLEPASVLVSDDGPGVAPALVNSLFDAFVTSRTRGTGLGLAISRQAADAMGGSLDLLPRSDLGGAAFRLSLAAP